jgi:A/G-specific adenine glycosylase
MTRRPDDPIKSGLITSRFRKALLRWFDRKKRMLPWRGETNPYRILVSEIMLQQTRVAVVEERYVRFLRQFPSLSRLARARQTSVLAAWSGLGYYRRARFLHDACRAIHRRGGFPRSAAELAELPGIGRYTAAAVASIAFSEPVAVVDGNVQRVLQRCVGRQLSMNECWPVAEGLLEKCRPGDFNQAMMELGATICLPRQPMCSKCPVNKLCASSGAAITQGSPEPRRKAQLGYLFSRKNGSVYLHQRDTHLSLMPGMWELPPTKNIGMNGTPPILQLRHSITNTDYRVFVFPGRNQRIGKGQWVNMNSLRRLPLTGLTQKILRKLDLL